MKKSDIYKDDIEKLIGKYSEPCIELNDYLANNPEISGKEYNSSKKIVELLRTHGIDVEYPFAGLDTAFKANVSGNSADAPKIAILAEYDALPEIGHGCGHCASGTISVLSALVLNNLKDEIDGQIDIIGTPDEEIMGGKVTMAKEGAFDNYDYVIMMHMCNNNLVYSEFLALDAMKVEFFGRTSHAAASPWEGINSLNAVQLFFHSMDMMRQHVKNDVRIHGIIKEGGKASNIVPDYSLAEVCTRSLDREYLDEISEWVRDCARAAAMATKTEVNIEALGPPFKDLSRNRYAVNVLRELYEDCHLEVTDKIDVSGSSDIGELDYICPTFHPFICVKEGIDLHTKEFADEMTTENGHNSILNGARIISSFVLETILDKELMINIKSEHQKIRNKN